MKRVVKLGVGTGLSYILFLVAVWFALHGVSDRTRGIAFTVLAVIGAVVAGVVAWYLWRRVPSAPPADDEVAQLFAAASSYLASAPATRGQSLRTTPAVIVLGRSESAKTTLVVRSPFDSVLLAGRVRRDDDAAPPPTSVGNVWYTPQAMILEAGGSLIGDAQRWPNFVRRLLPARGFSALFKGVQASRVAVVCLSCEELLQPNAGEGLAKTVGQLHSAISDLSTSIGIRLPVYVVFTKADLIPGFRETVAVMTRDEAREVIGATFPIATDEPAGLYTERQSSLLTQRFTQLFHAFALDRTRILARGADLERRALAYEFSREFRKLIPPAVQFLVELCRPNPLRASAFLRGFYFIGVRPVVDESAAVEPIAAAETSFPSVGGATAVLSGAAVAAELAKRSFTPASGRRKPQWVFLDRLFSEVILADHTALGFTSQGKRVDVLRRGVAVIAAVLASIFLIGTTISFFSNYSLESRVASAMSGVAAISPEPDGRVSLVSLRRLDTLRLLLNNELDPDGGGAPLSQRWGLYSGHRLLDPARRTYFSAFEKLLLAQTRVSLERRLSALGQAEAAGAVYDSSYDALKAYLIITDFPDSSTAPVSIPLTSAWKEQQKQVGAEELNVANQQFVYFATTLPRLKSTHARSNPQTVEVARRFVNQFANGQRVYQVMVDEVGKPLKPYSFSVANPTTTDVIRDTAVVPGAFTREGWKKLHEELGRIGKYTMAEQWVTGDAKRLSPAERDSLVAYVRQRYVADFAGHWRSYLRSATVLAGGTLQAEGKRIQTLAGAASPLLRLLAAASLNTSVDTTVLGNRFHAVRAVVPAAAGDVLIQPQNAPYMTALAELGNSAAAATDAKAAEDVRAAAKKLADAASQLSQTFRPDPEGDVDRVVKALLDAPSRTVSGLAQGVTAVETEAHDFCAAFMNVANRYPINPDSADASAAEFTGMFHPVNGRVAKLLRGPLRDVVSVQGTHVTRRADAAYQVSPQFLTLLDKSLEIGQAFWAGSGSAPSFTFTVRGQPGGAVPRISLTLDDQAPMVWAAGATQARDVTWNAGTGKSAMVLGQYGGGSEMTSTKQGPWAVLRLFGEAKRVQATDVFEWAIDPTTASNQTAARAIRLQVDRGQNILSRSIFSGLRQCAMIDR